MRKILQPLMLSCKKAGELTEKKQLVGLTVVEKTKLRMHVKVCAVCNAYQRHSELLDKALTNYVSKNNLSLSLSEVKKVEIQESLKIQARKL